MINSKVWNSIALFESWCCWSWMSVLSSFACWISDWIRLYLEHSGAKSIFCFGQMSISVDNILIKSWLIVIKSVLSNIVPFGLWVGSSHYKLVIVHCLSNFDWVHCSNHIWVFTEVIDFVVDSCWGPWVIWESWIFVLSDLSKWWSNWVRLNFNIGIKLNICFINNPLVFQLFLGILCVLKRSSNFIILSKVWNEIVDWMSCWVTEVIITHFFVKELFRLS